MIEETEADCVVNGISGAAGFLPSVRAIESGKTLALANKETLVMAGTLVKELALKHKTAVIPVDSEHSAVFHLTRAFGAAAVKSVILTASGGPFRDAPQESLAHVRPAEALRHPTWNMGKKITIDSASLANKGLEVIEAHHLFDLPAEKITVLIHPQSYVHSLIETHDGMQYAQIGKPDMRAPILSALTWPDPCGLQREPSAAAWTPGRFSLEGMSLSFSQPDTKKFPMLRLAYECLRQAGAWPLVYNAANEIAVEEFLRGSLSFTGIPELVSRTLEAKPWPVFTGIEEVLRLDSEARLTAKGFCS
jgi:1-deoxy-D-xylulose-5-phosphate reductoisomerase